MEVRTAFSCYSGRPSLFGGVVAYSVTRSYLTPQQSGAEGLIGAFGQARSNMSEKKAKVFVTCELWDAISEQAIEAGERIEVLGINGMVLNVHKAKGGSK